MYVDFVMPEEVNYDNYYALPPMYRILLHRMLDAGSATVRPKGVSGVYEFVDESRGSLAEYLHEQVVKHKTRPKQLKLKGIR